LGIGDWGLGIGDWAQSPIPNPQSPIPNPQSPIIINIYVYFNKILNLMFNIFEELIYFSLYIFDLNEL